MAREHPGLGVKDKGLYERLRGAGVSKMKPARVANAASRTSRKKVSTRGGAAGSYDDWKVPDLRRRAKQVGIAGRSAVTMKQPVKALRTSAS